MPQNRHLRRLQILGPKILSSSVTAEVWIAVTWWISALPVLISHWILMKNITGAINHMNLQKILALMALYLWTHGAKKGAMVHVPPTQGTQGTCKAKGIPPVQLLSHPRRLVQETLYQWIDLANWYGVRQMRSSTDLTVSMGCLKKTLQTQLSESPAFKILISLILLYLLCFPRDSPEARIMKFTRWR